MMKNLLLLLVLFVVTITSLVTISLFAKEEPYKAGVSAELDRAVIRALGIYKEKKDFGYDFSNGPCLTNDLLPDWVVDTVHNPRSNIDDLPENQCQAFREG